MSCSQIQGLYRIDSKMLKWAYSRNCSSNMPIVLELLPFKNRKDSLVFKFKNEFKRPIKYRVGIYILKTEGNDPTNFNNPNAITIWSKKMK